MHAPVNVRSHERVTLKLLNRVSLFQRIWPPAVLICMSLLTLVWGVLLMYGVARIAATLG
jgi:hypothetical protein